MPEMLHVGNLSNPTVYMKTMERFRGVDFSSGETACAEYRSPNAMNMMPDRNGYPVKRPGYKAKDTFGDKIWGAYRLTIAETGDEFDVIHAGRDLAIKGESAAGETITKVMKNVMEYSQSSAWQIGNDLWITDGVKLKILQAEINENEVNFGFLIKAEDVATVPLITISKAPNGENGATSYRPVNLLTGKRTDSYLGTAEDKDYYTSFQGFVDGSEVKVAVLDASGVWRESTEGSLAINGKTLTWTVDATLGKISFSEPVGAPPVTGEDNVRITYEVESRADVINKMRIGIVYGVGGAMDRLFLSGNPDEPTVDRWSEWNDQTYFPDTNYAELGQDGAPIIGYSILGDKLVTHKRSETEGRNAFVREGFLEEDGDAVFRTVNVITGEGGIAEKSFQSFGGEPVFLTKDGVFALTPSDLTGERYTQQRSYFLNGALLREPNLEKAKSCVWGRFYCLAVNDKIYLLDNEQKSYEARSPNSSFQYEGYVFNNVEASALWVDRTGRLCFGTKEGKLCVFGDPLQESDGTDYKSAGENDPAAVEAWWSTPLMELESWSELKSIKNVWVTVMPYSRSGGEIWYASDRKSRTLVRQYKVNIFTFSTLKFSGVGFNAISRGMIFPARKKEKKVKVFQVVVKNEQKEAFGLLAITMHYTKGGKIK